MGETSAAVSKFDAILNIKSLDISAFVDRILKP
jgi:hypothetical protein